MWRSASEDDLAFGVVEVYGTVTVDLDQLERRPSWFSVRALDLAC